MSLIKAINSGSRNEVLQIISTARAQGKVYELAEERNKSGESPLILAIKKKYGNIAQMIIEIDNNIDYAIPKTGYTALMYACKSGQTKLVLKLIEKGADISIHNLENKTASDIAIENNHPDCVPHNIKQADELTQKLDLLKINIFEENKTENKEVELSKNVSLPMSLHTLSSNSIPPIAPYEDIVPLTGNTDLEEEGN